MSCSLTALFCFVLFWFIICVITEFAIFAARSGIKWVTLILIFDASVNSNLILFLKLFITDCHIISFLFMKLVLYPIKFFNFDFHNGSTKLGSYELKYESEIKSNSSLIFSINMRLCVCSRIFSNGEFLSPIPVNKAILDSLFPIPPISDLDIWRLNSARAVYFFSRLSVYHPEITKNNIEKNDIITLCAQSVRNRFFKSISSFECKLVGFMLFFLIIFL